MTDSALTFEQAKEIEKHVRDIQALVKGEREFHGTAQSECYLNNIKELEMENINYQRGLKRYSNVLLAKKLKVDYDINEFEEIEEMSAKSIEDLENEIKRETGNNEFLFYSTFPSLYRFFYSKDCIDFFFKQIRTNKSIQKTPFLVEYVFQTPEFVLFIRTLFTVAKSFLPVVKSPQEAFQKSWNVSKNYFPYLALKLFQFAGENNVKNTLVKMLTKGYKNLYCIPEIPNLQKVDFSFLYNNVERGDTFSTYLDDTYSIVKGHLKHAVYSYLDESKKRVGINFTDKSKFRSFANKIWIVVSDFNPPTRISTQTQMISQRKYFRHILKYSRCVPVLRSLPPDVKTVRDLLRKLLIDRTPTEYMDDVFTSFANDNWDSDPNDTIKDLRDIHESNSVATIESESIKDAYRVKLQKRVVTAIKVFASQVQNTLQADLIMELPTFKTRTQLLEEEPDLPMHEKIFNVIIKSIIRELPLKEFCAPTNAVFEMAMCTEDDGSVVSLLKLFGEMAEGWIDEAYLAAFAYVKTRKVIETARLVFHYTISNPEVTGPWYSYFIMAINKIYPGIFI